MAGVLDGQLWFTVQGGINDIIDGHVNSDATDITTTHLNPVATPGTGFQQGGSDLSIGFDLPNGLFFVVNSDGLSISVHSITTGALIDTLQVGDFNGSTANQDIVNSLVVDPNSHTVYVGRWGETRAESGIVAVSYTTAGDLANNQAYDGGDGAGGADQVRLVNGTQTGGITDVRYMDLSNNNQTLYYTDNDNHYTSAPFSATNGIFKIDLNNPAAGATLLSSQVQFPTDLSNGLIGSVTADEEDGIIYFTTHHFTAGGVDTGQDALWWMPIGGGTATKITLPAGALHYAGEWGGLSYDRQTGQLYISDEDPTAGGLTGRHIIQLQMGADGKTVSSVVNTYTVDQLVGHTADANAYPLGTSFDLLPAVTVTAAATHAVEQVATPIDLTTLSTSVTDADNNFLASATAQITGGTFVSNETSANDDHLSVNDGGVFKSSGSFTGTNITVSYDSATEKLTLSGVDTLAHYQTVLNAVSYNTTGDNPTNYGNNITRTIHWTASDGAQNVPFGAQNSQSTTITIDAVNDAPVNHVAASAPTGSEDTAFAITGVSVTDPDADPVDHVGNTASNQNIIVALSVLHGTLTVGSVADGAVVGNASATVTLTGTQNSINAALASFQYTGNLNYNGSDTLSITSNDQGFGGSGGALQTGPTTRTIAITPVNDAPTVTLGTAALATILEDAAQAPQTISSLLTANFADAADAQNSVSNPTGSVANTLAGIAISANAANAATQGIWQWSTDGTNWNSISTAVSNAGALVLTAATQLRFSPVANFNGTAPALTAHLVDSSAAISNNTTVNLTTTGTGGTTQYSTATVAIGETVTAVNDAPTVIGGNTASLTTINEDTAVPSGQLVSTLLGSHFSDAADTVVGGSSANNFAGIVISANTVTTQGTWQWSSNGTTWNSISGASDSSALLVAANAHLRFVPAADFNGPAPALTVHLVDDSSGAVTSGNTVNLTTTGVGGSTPYSSNTNTVALSETITSVNDAPTALASSVTTNEDTPKTFAASDFLFSDTHDSPPNTLLNLIVTSVPTHGTLTLGGNPVAVNAVIAAGAIGTLVYTPTGDYNGPDSFNFKIQDNGTTADGGQDTSAAAATMSITVNSVDDAPIALASSVTTNEDAPKTFAASDFQFSDTHDAPDALLNVIITSVPTHGTLTLGGNPVAANAVIAAGSIGTLVYTPTGDFHGADSFNFKVQDNGTTANGGQDTSAAAATMSITVNSVDDAPIALTSSVTTNEDAPKTFAASDFQFSDTHDAPDGLLNVIITSLSTHGTLKLGATNVQVNDVIAAGSIGNLVYTPTGNYNGSDGFDFKVQDNGTTANGGQDTSASAATMSITVNSVADAPAGTDTTVTASAATDYVFGTADFGFTDPNDTPADNFVAVQVDHAPDHGTLKLNGTEVDLSGGPVLIAVTDIALGHLTFTVDPLFPGLDSGLKFAVQDDGSTANGGINLDQSPNTLSINVKVANSAPVGLDSSVAVHQDTPYHFVTTDFGFTDPNDTPANHLAAVEITTVPNTGTLTLNGSPVAATDFVAVADIAAGLLVFTPGGTDPVGPYDSFTFQVQDDGSTNNGGVILDATPNAMTINIVGANNAPAGTDNSKTINEDTSYTFTAADFGFVDTDNPQDHLLAVEITTIPLAGTGTLTDNGSAVTAGQFVSVADINANKLVFTPAANANGTPEANFTFQVQDDGGTANAGVDLDASPNTFTFNVTSVNDAPVGTAGTVTTLEDTAYTFATTDFGFTDPNDTPANSLFAVKITTVPGAGTLTDNGAAVTAGQSVAVADITGGLLKFTPAANANGAGYASFTFQVQDNGGTSPGVDLDPTPKTITVDVTVVNDAPAGADTTKTIDEDTLYTFAATDFGFTDPNDTLANSLFEVKIATLASAGTLTDNGVAVTAGQSVAVADITGGLLKFTPTANANGTNYSHFTFQVQDDGGTANTGVDLDASPNTFTFNVTSVNDAPSAADKTVTTLEDTAYTFATADFGFTDPNDTPANSLLAVKITTVPGAGTLTDNGAALTAGQSVAVADITGGLLKFTPAANANGAGYASFTFQVQDNGGTSPGVDLDPTPKTITVDVTVVNDAPAGADTTKTIDEDTPYTFAAADFGFTDPNDTPANNLLAVKITTLASAGTLTDNGVAVTAGQSVAVADITGGLLKFTPMTNASGTSYSHFTFQVQDDGGTSPGVDLDASPNTFTFNVTSVNDAPVGTAGTVTTLEDTAYTFATGDFGFTDPNDTPANSLFAVKITTVPGAGTLTDNGAAVTAGQSVAVADITGGLLKFTPAANANGAGYASFTFQVQDNGGTSPGVDLDPTPKTITVDVTPVNDAPTLANVAASAAYSPGAGPVVLAPALTINDVDSTTLSGATVHINSASTFLGDVLAANGQTNGVVPGHATINAVYNPGNATLTLTGVASLTEYQDVLQTVTFQSTSATPTNGGANAERIVEWQVNDGSGLNNLSNVPTTDIKLHTLDLDADDSTVSGTGYATTFTEKGAAVAVAGDSFSDVTINDADSTVMQSATITLNNHKAFDLLSVNGPLPAGITASSYDSGTGVLTLTTTSGAPSATDYQTALHQMVFSNSSSAPDTTDRDISIVVRDSLNVDTNPAHTTVAVIAVNDKPVIDAHRGAPGGSLNFTENDAATAIDAVLTVTDADSANLSGAIVAITGNFHAGEDVLGFVDQNGISGSYDPGTGVLTLSGTSSVANYEAALRSVSYFDGSENPSGDVRTISYQSTDDVAVPSDVVTTTVAVVPVNDVPTATITPTSYSTTEQVSLALKGGIAVSDVDGGPPGTETVHLTVSEGILNVTAGGSLATVANSGTADVTITGTIAQINALLNTDGTSTVSYKDNTDTPSASATLTLLIHDNGNTGTGGDHYSSDTAAINITAVNDAPVFTNLGEGTHPNFVENGFSVVLDNNVTVNDPELNAAGNYGGATLTLARNGGANPDDTFAATGSLDLADSNGLGENLSLDGGATFIGTFHRPGDGTFSITFNASATAANVASVMQQIAYANASDNPDNPTVQINWSFSDGNTGSQGTGGEHIATGSVTVDITPVDDTPVAVNASASGSEDTPISGVVSATDVDNTPSQLSYSLVGANGGAAHGAVVFHADGSYTYTPVNDFNGSDSFSFKANDGQLDSNVATVSLAVSAVNDAPVAANGSASGNEDTPISGGVSATDVDNTPGQLSYALVGANGGATHGTVAFNTNGTFTYTPASNFNGSDSFSFKANDGALDSNAATESLTINAVNDAPVNTVPGPLNAQNGLDAAIIGLAVGDVDAVSLTTSLHVDHGTLSVAAVGGATVVGSGTGIVTLSGSVAQIDAALAAQNNVLYHPAFNFAGTDHLTMTTNDGGGTGSGGPQTDTDVVDINAGHGIGAFIAFSILGSSDFHLS